MLSGAPFAVSTGLVKKPTYEELINYIEKDPDRIKYPDRQASILRNSHWLTQLDGEGWNQLETQQSLERQNAMRTMLLQQMAGAYRLNFGLLQHVVNRLNLRPVRGGGPPPPQPGPPRAGPFPPGGGGGFPGGWGPPVFSGDSLPGSQAPPSSAVPVRHPPGPSGGQSYGGFPGGYGPSGVEPLGHQAPANSSNLRPNRNPRGDVPSVNPAGPAQPLPPRQTFAQEVLNTTLNVAGQAASSALGLAAGSAAASAGLPAVVAEAIGTGVDGLVRLTTSQLARMVSDMQRPRQPADTQNQGPLATQPSPPPQQQQQAGLSGPSASPGRMSPVSASSPFQMSTVPSESGLSAGQLADMMLPSAGQMSPVSSASGMNSSELGRMIGSTTSSNMSLASSMEDVVWQQIPSAPASASAGVEDDSVEIIRWRAQQLANAEQMANTYRYAERQARIAQQTARVLGQTDTVIQQAAHTLARIAEAQSGSASASASVPSASASALPQFDGVIRPAPMKKARPTTFGDIPGLTEALRISADRVTPMNPPPKPPPPKASSSDIPTQSDSPVLKARTKAVFTNVSALPKAKAKAKAIGVPEDVRLQALASAVALSKAKAQEAKARAEARAEAKAQAKVFRLAQATAKAQAKAEALAKELSKAKTG